MSLIFRDCVAYSSLEVSLNAAEYTMVVSTEMLVLTLTTVCTEIVVVVAAVVVVFNIGIAPFVHVSSISSYSIHAPSVKASPSVKIVNVPKLMVVIERNH